MKTPIPPASAVELVEGANRILNMGDRQSAYRMSLEATRIDPENVEAWLMRSRAAPTNEERLFSLSQVSRIDPNHPEAKEELYRVLRSELEQNPFLAYIDETEQVYFVRSNEYLSLPVPKDRAIPETYPPKRPQALAQAYRWLGWAVLGLMPAGIGTLIFAPLAIRGATDALDQPLARPDRIRAGLIVYLSILLVAIAIFLGWVFMIHLTG